MSEAAAYRGAPPSTRLLADVGMGVCLMIERQEDVTWQQWLALAEVCERGGFEGLFRSDHYLSVFGHEQRGVARFSRSSCVNGPTTRCLSRAGTTVSTG
jgi:hypothetical protein